jgi:DNA-binding response OmpR family regulator
MLSPQTILVVQQSPTIRRMLAHSLERRGYRVLQASGSHSGREVLESARVDLVMSDLNLPGLGGERLVQHLRGTTKNPTVAVLLMTASEVEPVAGASGQLARPFTPGVLESTVRELLC